MSCAAARTAAFEVDLSLTTLTFTVSSATISHSALMCAVLQIVSVDSHTMPGSRHCRPLQRFTLTMQAAQCGESSAMMLGAHTQVGTIGYIVLDTCTAVYLHGPTTLTYSQAQFPLAQGTIVTVTDYLHYTIQARSAAAPPCRALEHCLACMHA